MDNSFASIIFKPLLGQRAKFGMFLKLKSDFIISRLVGLFNCNDVPHLIINWILKRL